MPYGIDLVVFLRLNAETVTNAAQLAKDFKLSDHGIELGIAIKSASIRDL